MKRLMILLLVLVLTAVLASCGKSREANRTGNADLQAKVLATVNDVPITEYDLKLIQKSVPTGMGDHQGSDQNILQTLVRDELIYQKALELGLDKNQEYRQKLAEAEAQLRAFQRQAMSSLYFINIKVKAEVTEAEAQDYFQKNMQRMQTQYHIWQIFYKGKLAEITKDNEDLKKGAPFEKVAARRFPNLPAGIKAPWDLGYLYWNQMPPAWQGVVDRLEPGQVTDIIKGDKERFWVIKLVAKKVDAQLTFATEKQRIIAQLNQQKAQELYNQTLSELNSKAKIAFPK